MLTPERKTKRGAQKCVIHRERKSGTVVFVTSVGSNWNPCALMKSRVWSIIMMIMTMPRRISIASSLVRAVVVATGFDAEGVKRGCESVSFRLGTLGVGIGGSIEG